MIISKKAAQLLETMTDPAGLRAEAEKFWDKRKKWEEAGWFVNMLALAACIGSFVMLFNGAPIGQIVYYLGGAFAGLGLRVACDKVCDRHAVDSATLEDKARQIEYEAKRPKPSVTSGKPVESVIPAADQFAKVSVGARAPVRGKLTLRQKFFPDGNNP